MMKVRPSAMQLNPSDNFERVAREHALLLEAIAATPGPVAVYDDQDRLIAWNEAYARVHAAAFMRHADAVARREMRYDDVVREEIAASAPPEAVERLVAARVAAHRRGDGVAVDRRYDGLGWLRVSKIRTPSGAVAGFSMQINELVEKAAELERARADEETARRMAEDAVAVKGRFIADVSHELRTPLGGVLGLAAVLAQTELSDHQRKLVQTIQRSGEDMLAVLNDLLDDAQLSHGAFALNPAPFSLTALITDSAALFSARAMAKGLTLEAHVAPGSPDALVGDAMRLRQVLGNLLSNAIKFTARGGIRLNARAAPVEGGVAVRLSVADEGSGMTEEQAAGLFTDYAQLAEGKALGRGGTGLGLSIARRIVQAMGGTISVASAPGAGATFTVALTLPAA